MDHILGEQRGMGSARNLTIALGIGVAYLLLPFITGLLGAGILYTVSEPLLRRVRGTRVRSVGALATVLLLFVVLVLPGIWLFVELLIQLPDAALALQRSDAFQRLLAFRIGGIDVGAQVEAAISELVRWSSRQTIALLGGVASATVNLVIALFGTYYLLVSGDRLWRLTSRLLPFDAAIVEVLRTRFRLVTEAMVLGIALTGVAQGLLVGIALDALRFEHALFWGVVTAACSVIPTFGSAFVWLPAAALLAAQGRFASGAMLAAFGALVVSNVDNALRLFVYNRVSQVHPMVTLLGAFSGVRLFGPSGLLLGPLVLLCAIELLQVRHTPDPPSRAGPPE